MEKKYRLLTIIIALFLASFACNLYYYRKYAELDFYMPFTRFWEIFIGVALAALAEHKKQPLCADSKPGNSCVKALWTVVAKDDWCHARNALSVLGLLCLFVAVSASSSRHFPGHRAVWPTLGAALIIAAGSRAWLNRKILSNKFFVGIGLISYPLYLWHWPLISFAAILNGEFAGTQQWLHIRFICVFLSIVLALLTYILVECPLRFGKGSRKIKICALSIMLFCIACIGLCISLAGVPERSFMKPYQSTIKSMYAMARPVGNDGSILRYAPELQGLSYARYHDAGVRRTVAVIGDSHAPPVFQGIAESVHGLNSVLLEYSPQAQQAQERALAVIKEKKDISDVFIVMRGVRYLTGEDTDGVQSDYRLRGNFKPWLQNLVDGLRDAGKWVYIISENPVFPYSPRVLIRRPFFNFVSESSIPVVTREDVYKHQKEYLDMLSGIHGAEIINGMDLFFVDNICSMLKNGVFMYADDDHLSAYGGRYLVENLLEPYISAIAERERGE